MKTLMTASRLGLVTSLKWIVMDKNFVMSVIKKGGEEIPVSTKEDFYRHYSENNSGQSLNDFFKGYRFEKTTSKEDKLISETMKENAPSYVDVKLSKDEIKPEDVQGLPTFDEGKETIECELSGDEQNVVESVENFWRLAVYRKGEEIMTMEFEDEKDLYYRHQKWKEKYPDCQFEKQTIESFVKSVAL